MSQRAPIVAWITALWRMVPGYIVLIALAPVALLPSPVCADNEDAAAREILDEVELADGEILRGDVLRITDQEVVLRVPRVEVGGSSGTRRWWQRAPIDRDLVEEIRLRELLAIQQARSAMENRDWALARHSLHAATWGERDFSIGTDARQALSRCMQQVDLADANALLELAEEEPLQQALAIFARARKVSQARAGLAEQGLRQAAQALAAIRARFAEQARASLERGMKLFHVSRIGKAHDEFEASVQLLRRSLEGVALPLEFVPDFDSVRTEYREMLQDAEYWLDRCRSQQRRLVYGEAIRPTSLLPLPGARPSAQRLGHLVYESLVTLTPEESFAPHLAERWDASPDGLVWSFLLRRDAVFSDGAPLAAQDVLATIEALTNPGTVGHDPVFAHTIRDVVAESARRVSVRLAHPYYLPLSLFTFKVLPRIHLQDRALVRTHRLAKEPMGSGPFRYRTGLGSRVIELDRNPHFQRARVTGRPPQRPLLSGISMRAYADRNAARNDLEKGSTQLLADLRPLDVEFFAGQRGFRVMRYRSRTISMLAFNHRHDLLALPDIRRAIAHAVDRQAIIEQYFGASNVARGRSGLAHAVITGPFPRGSWAYDDSVEGHPYHLHRASELIRRVLLPLGWRRDGAFWERNGEALQLTLAFPRGERSVEQAVNYIRKTLRKIGIRLKLAKKIPLDLYDEVVGRQEFDLVYWDHTFLGEPDPLPLLDARRTKPGGSNFSGYIKPAVMERFAAIQRSGDAREILRLTHEIHQQVARDCAFVFLWQLDRYAGCSADLKGIRIHPYLLFGSPERWKLVRDPTATPRSAGR